MVHSGGGICFARLPPHFRFRGLSQTKAASERGEEACHVFKFVRRESLDPKIVIHSPFSGAEESPRDVVLLVKAFMGSLELAQVPEVCLSFVGLKYLGDPPPPENGRFEAWILTLF